MFDELLSLLMFFAFLVVVVMIIKVFNKIVDGE